MPEGACLPGDDPGCSGLHGTSASFGASFRRGDFAAFGPGRLLRVVSARQGKGGQRVQGPAHVEEAGVGVGLQGQFDVVRRA